MNFKIFTGTALSITLGTLSGYAILAGGYASAETNTRISQQQPTQPAVDTQQPVQPGVQTQPTQPGGMDTQEPVQPGVQTQPTQPGGMDTQQPAQPGVQTQPGFEDDFDDIDDNDDDDFQLQQQTAPQEQPVRGMW